MSLSASRRIPKIAVVAADPAIRRALAQSLADAGYLVASAEDGVTGLEIVQRDRPDAVILDRRLPDLDGLEALQRIHEFDRGLPVIFVTAQETSRAAIEAMKRGAFDYLSKPLDETRLRRQVESAVEARRLMRTPVQVDDGEKVEADVDPLIGHSPAMHEVFKWIGRLAPLDVPILIEGEPGTGKKSVARTLFENGPRAGGPFTIVRCAEFEPAELEAELFGSEDAAPEDAPSPATRSGRIEQTAGGVLVLDEIGRLSPAAQSRLMRLLRDREFERCGGRQTRQADVQVIALGLPGLETQAAQQRFRSDLYHYLRSFRIEMPPLRRRVEDLPLLVDYFVKQFSHLRGAPGKEPVRVSPASLALLARYDWPGNLDELQSVLRRSLVETNGTVVATDFLAATLGEPPTSTEDRPSATDWRAFAEVRLAEGSQRLYADAVAEMERRLLTQVLAAANGNQARSARMLGITRGNLRKKLRALGLAAAPRAEAEERPATSADA